MSLLLLSVVVQLIAAGNAFNMEGLVPSVFTPFDDDGVLNLDVIPQYAEYLHKNNVDGALVAGTASEGPSLSLAERKALLDAWVKAASPLGLKVVMHVGGLPLPEVLELTRYSETVGPDAILTLPELYYKPADVEALVRYVKLVSEAAPSLPILYYDHPSLSGVKCFISKMDFGKVTPESVSYVHNMFRKCHLRASFRLVNMPKFFALATKTIPNFKGIKCNFVTAVDISASNDLNDDQRIFMASHSTIASAQLMGYNSSMTTISNLFPGMMLDIERAVLQHDVDNARELQQKLNKRVAVITEQGSYVPFVKAAMEYISGIKVGSTREPLARVTEVQEKILRENIRKMID